MSKKKTPKQQLQEDYLRVFGNHPDPKMTVADLNVSLHGEDLKKTEKEMSEKEWVSDHNLLVTVEGKRESLLSKNKKGEVVGGTKYYGELK